MKKHAANVAIAGVAGTIALALATVIANELQTLLGLHLEAVALAIYLTPFVAAAGLIFHKLVALEEKRVLEDLGSNLGGLDLGGLLGGLMGDVPTTPVVVPPPYPAAPPPPAAGSVPPPAP